MTAPLPTLFPVDDVYADLEPLVRRTAARFARHYGLPFDDCYAEANYQFVRAARKHDPARSSIEARVVYVVWHGLADWRRTAAKQAARLPRADYDPDLIGAADAGGFDRSDVAAGLGRDARAVLRLLDEAPPSVWKVLRSIVADDTEWSCIRNYARGATARTALRNYLAGFGWDADRSEAAFTEISGALA